MRLYLPSFNGFISTSEILAPYTVRVSFVSSTQYSLIFFQGDKQLDGYQKKKYVCKLLFIFLLGHDIDFGHMEAVNLLSSNKYTEKQIVSI